MNEQSTVTQPGSGRKEGAAQGRYRTGERARALEGYATARQPSQTAPAPAFELQA